MRLLVAGKAHARIPEQLVANRVAKSMVLLRNHDCGRVLLSQVVHTLNEVPRGEALARELGAGCCGTDKLQVLKHFKLILIYLNKILIGDQIIAWGWDVVLSCKLFVQASSE